MSFKKIMAAIMVIVSPVAASLNFKPTVNEKLRLDRTINLTIQDDINNTLGNLDIECNIADFYGKHTESEEHVIDISGFNDKEFELSEKDLEYYLPLYNFNLNRNNYLDVIRKAFYNTYLDDDITLVRFARQESSQSVIERKFFETISRTDISIDNFEDEIDRIGTDDFVDEDLSRAYGSEAAIWVQGSYFTLATLASFICTKLGTLFSIISGAIKAFVAALAVPWVGWTIAALVLIGIVITIVLNWSKICSCFEHIKAWFTAVDKNKHTASINNTFNQMSSKAVAQAKEDAYIRTRSQTNIGNFTRAKLEQLLRQSVHCGYTSITLEKMLEEDKYVYLGRFSDITGAMDYRWYGKTRGGIFFETSSAVSDVIRNLYNSNYWALNLFFLNYCIASGKIFRLCSQPYSYYNQDTGVIVHDCSYAKELKYIHENPFVKYYWCSNIPIVETYKA